MLQQSSCPSCGAPVVFEQSKPQVQCAYCRSALVPLQRGNEITLEALDKVNQTLERTSIATQSAIADAQRVTQWELQRVRLSQELSAAQTQLSQVQSEQRMLARVPRKDGTVHRQMQELRASEVRLLNRIAAIEKELGITRASPQRASTRSRGCNALFLTFIAWFGSLIVFGAILSDEWIVIAFALSVVVAIIVLLKTS